MQASWGLAVSSLCERKPAVALSLYSQRVVLPERYQLMSSGYVAKGDHGLRLKRRLGLLIRVDHITGCTAWLLQDLQGVAVCGFERATHVRPDLDPVPMGHGKAFENTNSIIAPYSGRSRLSSAVHRATAADDI